jgi:hypothetical protein
MEEKGCEESKGNKWRRQARCVAIEDGFVGINRSKDKENNMKEGKRMSKKENKEED